MEFPTFLDVLDAKRVLSDYLKITPIVSYPALNKLANAHIFVKREDCQPISSFKIRGGINLIAHLEPRQIKRGFVTASTGNHGQSIAYASKLFSTSCVIVVPIGANPLKVEAIENLGAEVIFSGSAIEASQEHAFQIAQERGMNHVHPANEPLLIAGVATETLEILEAVPDLDYLFLPIGAGSTAAGASIVAQTIQPDLKLIGVQSRQAPAAQSSWATNNLQSVPARTEAEGLATSNGYELPQAILSKSLHDFILVEDKELKAAVRIFVEKCHTLSELAGAAALAGALSYKRNLQQKRVGIILSGSNITTNQLREALSV